MVTIRQASLDSDDDCKNILRLLEEYSLDPMGGNESLPVNSKENLINEMRKRSTIFVFLAFNDESAAIGLAITIESFSTFACSSILNIHDFVISKDYRSKGIGKKLMNYVCNFAKEKGFAKCTLEVLQGNAPAKGCYKASGFEPYMLSEEIGICEFWQKKL